MVLYARMRIAKKYPGDVRAYLACYDCGKEITNDSGVGHEQCIKSRGGEEYLRVNYCSTAELC